ncbi:hypothetical protein HG535_0C06340 [Zygotorulaspora mrakii]|uniref:C2H2-type domain-containing protein n=1 Tax=Zygotorulaspora mrakii TaxID=42260 RepID=A0A7H9B2S8_ZYGMR|nr:uncharacterized protein HG535_0C06340 [Zygotorulaspora mrakii]QLG72279.1 hypothetical protein HG535_0C06340 [Zygotorulaspora mrakii]
MSTSEKKRKRGAGPFICQHPECRKVFSRSDHLARHRANHTSNRFECEWPGCGRLFTRLDVKKKHERRHTTGGPLVQDERLHSSFVIAGKTTTTSETEKREEIAGKPDNKERQKTDGNLEVDDNIHFTQIGFPSAEQESSPQAAAAGTTDYAQLQLHSDGSISPEMKYSNPEPLLPAPSIQWLLNDSMNVSPSNGRSSTQPENGAFYSQHEDPLGPSTLAMLQEIFALSPEFPHADSQTEIDRDTLFKMINYIPQLQNHPDFVIPKIKWFLETYWLLYHCQYPILHRPSFSTFDTQPLLLLSMIMMGASFSKKTTPPEHVDLVDTGGLADIIAEPLRWMLFASEQAKPPCKAWVIQSLIHLETYEITSTSRALHERACIYNGTKVQLLRRSPILGGDPLKEIRSDVTQSNSLWNTWIESESMKRVALMSFYIDTIHAVVFGHPVTLFANQIKLSLPCPDDLWEYNNVDRHKAPLSVAQTPLFCDALNKLLQKEDMNVGPFSRQILLAGLINLLLQIEQNISQWSNFGWKSIHENWRDTISCAIEHWKTQLPFSNCCLTSSSIYHCEPASPLHPSLPPFLRAEDTRCSFPVYHAAQIYMRITHYDYIVYAGAPRRMNVPILKEDYEVAVERIGKWVKSPYGPLCVINSLILLCEMLLPPEDSMEDVNFFYEPDKDPYLYRPNIVISAILSLWAYTYYCFGPESSFKSSKSDFHISEEYSPAVEDGSTYLRRIRSQFAALTGRSFATLNNIGPESNSKTVKEYYRVFLKITNIKHLVGLLTLLRNGYAKCKWEVGREYAKLLDNCIQRSLGSENIFCKDMYDIS